MVRCITIVFGMIEYVHNIGAGIFQLSSEDKEVETKRYVKCGCVTIAFWDDASLRLFWG